MIANDLPRRHRQRQESRSVTDFKRGTGGWNKDNCDNEAAAGKLRRGKRKQLCMKEEERKAFMKSVVSLQKCKGGRMPREKVSSGN